MSEVTVKVKGEAEMPWEVPHPLIALNKTATTQMTPAAERRLVIIDMSSITTSTVASHPPASDVLPPAVRPVYKDTIQEPREQAGSLRNAVRAEGAGWVHDTLGREAIRLFQNRDREGGAPVWWCWLLRGLAPRLRSGF